MKLLIEVASACTLIFILGLLSGGVIGYLVGYKAGAKEKP